MAGNQKPKPRKSRKQSQPGSLLSPQSMGGITAGKGFDFQARYAACHVPVWLLEAAFHQLFYEGTGDIDIRYEENGQSSRIHLQVKDHDVTPAEFKEVIAQFRKFDVDMPSAYKCFKLVCPSLSAEMRPIETGLSRFRNATPFYDDAPHLMAPTKAEIDQRLRAIGLSEDDVAFVHSKFFFEVGHGDLHLDDRAIDLFIGRVLKHPDYSGMIRAMVQPAFAELLRGIQGSRGAVLQRSDVENILRSAINAVLPGEKGITLWLQNWSREQFDLPADYSLDWSSEFDRATRRVPPEQVWNERLLPELQATKTKIAAERTERLIRFRGKCALSTAVAVGATFPSVGGWVFEIPQPPQKEPWRSDADETGPYNLQTELINGEGTDLVLGLNIRGDGREDVRRYISSTGLPPKLFAFMAPDVLGGQSIAGSGDACAFARGVREKLGQLLKTHEIRRTRLFFYGPLALAVLLGQQLTSVGVIQLFEYQDPGYVPTCTIRT